MWRIVTGDEKWIFFDNPKKKKSWLFLKENPPKICKRNIHGKKVLFCIFWDQKGVIDFELLKLRETVNAAKYCQQLLRLKEKISDKRKSLSNSQNKGVFFS